MRNKIRFYFISFIKQRSRAFSLTELMISMIVVAFVAGAFVTSLYMVLSSSRRTDDMVTMSHEIENSLNSLRWQFTNIGLGMPNNSGKTGTFSVSFTGSGENLHPIMAYMGDIERAETEREWGGPVTLASSDAHVDRTSIIARAIKRPISEASPDIYVGEELFYAWAVPTGVRLAAKGNGTGEWQAASAEDEDGSGWFSSEKGRNNTITLRFRQAGDVGRLVNFTSDDLKFGITDSSETIGASVRSWLLFPSFKVPLLIEPGGIDTTNNNLTVRVSPYSYRDTDTYKYNLAGELNGYEEVHLARAACLYVNDEKLIQRIYNTMDSYIDNTLATNISAAYYVFDRANSILTMHIVAHGNSVIDVRPEDNRAYLASMLPGEVRELAVNAVANETRRLFVESMTWRMKN